jgi:hypothetical protein
MMATAMPSFGVRIIRFEGMVVDSPDGLLRLMLPAATRMRP